MDNDNITLKDIMNVIDQGIETDDIALLIDNMRRQSHAMKYEDAQYILDKIKIELTRKIESNEFIRMFHVKTFRDVYNLVTSPSIRLDMNDYNFTNFLDLLENLIKRKEELQGGRYIDTNRQRKIVAEEMFKLGMTIPSKWRGIKPNRTFLDIAYKVNPSLASSELKRREQVKLYKGVENKKDKDIKAATDKLRKIKEDQLK